MTADQEGTSFRASVVRSGRRAVVRLAGELDSASAPQLEEALADLFADGIDGQPDAVVVEAGELVFTDVVGVGVLLDTADRLAPSGRLVVRDANREVSRVLTLLGRPELLD